MYALDNDHYLCISCWQHHAFSRWKKQGYNTDDPNFKFDQGLHKLVCPVPFCRFGMEEHEITREIKAKLFPKRNCAIF